MICRYNVVEASLIASRAGLDGKLAQQEIFWQIQVEFNYGFY